MTWIQVVTLTYIGCTFGPDKNRSHEHDHGCTSKVARRDIDKWTKQFVGVAIIMA